MGAFQGELNPLSTTSNVETCYKLYPYCYTEVKHGYLTLHLLSRLNSFSMILDIEFSTYPSSTLAGLSVLVVYILLRKLTFLSI